MAGYLLTVGHRAKSREAEMKSEWPALLEGMAVASLSGLDLSAAFLASARRVGGALRDEVDKAAVRLAGGTQLSRALLVMAKDGVPGADRLRSLLLRCEVLGTPVADVLESLAAEAITVERQEIEGRFNALPLRLSVVTVLFLLPPVLIVSIAPHVLLFLNSRW
jgi:tight adherence protein C